MNDFREQFFTKIAEFFSVDRTSLSDNTTAANIDGWDSIRHTELILELEDMYELELPLMEIQAAANLRDLLAVIEKTIAMAQDL